MKKGSMLAMLIGIVAALAALAAVGPLCFCTWIRRKTTMELEHYLDCSIQ